MASLAASYSKWDTWNDESDDDTVEVRDGAARAQARLARARGLVAGTTEPEARPVPAAKDPAPPAPAPPRPAHRAERWAEAARLKTRGAAALSPFVIDNVQYLCVANFFETLKTAAGPTKGEAAPSTETTSSIWRIEDDDGLLVDEVQTFRSFGAHGVAHITSEGSHYLAVSMYYADFVAILKWDGARFEEHQRLPCEGGGGICAFVVDGQKRLAVAEFGKKGVSLFGLEQDKFHHLQYLQADGCCHVSTAFLNKRTYLIACANWSSTTKWRTASTVFTLTRDVFAPSFDLTGGEGSATITYQGRHFCFVAKHKNPDGTCCRRSPLYEWRRGKYQLVQELDHDDGAHGGCLFEATNNKLYLAIACCGDREKKSYSRNSPVYEISLDPEIVVRRKKSLPTTGAVAFVAFDLGGRTYLAVANEQDEQRGGNVESVVWAVT